MTPYPDNLAFENGRPVLSVLPAEPESTVADRLADALFDMGVEPSEVKRLATGLDPVVRSLVNVGGQERSVLQAVDFLTSGGDVKAIGRRMLFLAYRLRLPSAPASQRILAESLGITPAAVSLALNTFDASLARFYRAKPAPDTIDP